MKAQGVSIVIPTLDGKELLKRFLPSVMAAAEAYRGESEVIIVDDGSADGSKELLRSEFPRARVARLETNRGFAGACNEGFRLCTQPIVVLLNNDVLVDRDFIAPLVAHFPDRDVFGVRPGLTILNSAVPPAELERFLIGLEFKRGLIELPMMSRSAGQNSDAIFLLGGTSAAFDREKLLDLGGFDELFNPFYWEDADLSYRAWKRGWKIVYEPKSLAYHQTHSTVSRLRPRKYVEMISERNRYILVWKNLADRRLLFRHFCWIPLRLSALLLTGRWHKLPSLFLALRQWDKIMEKRKRELRKAKVADRRLFSYFSEIMKGGTGFGAGAE